jgi:hypothetical protein
MSVFLVVVYGNNSLQSIFLHDINSTKEIKKIMYFTYNKMTSRIPVTPTVSMKLEHFQAFGKIRV